eukprot:1322341-Amphidinium_carterae.1
MLQHHSYDCKMIPAKDLKGLKCNEVLQSHTEEGPCIVTALTSCDVSKSPLSSSRLRHEIAMLCVGSKSGGTAATDPQADTETRQEFENLKKVLENGQEPKETYRFKYKKKANVHWKGGPLHLACVQPPSKDVTEVVDKLLKK